MLCYSNWLSRCVQLGAHKTVFRVSRLSVSKSCSRLTDPDSTRQWILMTRLFTALETAWRQLQTATDLTEEMTVVNCRPQYTWWLDLKFYIISCCSRLLLWNLFLFWDCCWFTDCLHRPQSPGRTGPTEKRQWHSPCLLPKWIKMGYPTLSDNGYPKWNPDVKFLAKAFLWPSHMSSNMLPAGRAQTELKPSCSNEHVTFHKARICQNGRSSSLQLLFLIC